MDESFTPQSEQVPQAPPVYYTYRQLKKIAKERKIKYFARYKKDELEKILGLEISKPNETFEKYCKGKIKKPIPIILINRKTDEILNFKSMYAAAKGIGVNPQSISDRIRSKTDLCVGENTFIVIKAQ